MTTSELRMFKKSNSRSNIVLQIEAERELNPYVQKQLNILKEK